MEYVLSHYTLTNKVQVIEGKIIKNNMKGKLVGGLSYQEFELLRVKLR